MRGAVRQCEGPSGNARGFMAAQALITALSPLAQGAVPMGRRGEIGDRIHPFRVYRLLRGGVRHRCARRGKTQQAVGNSGVS